ncbi:MAG: hypothetical protein L3J63_00540 [Geopsychrobacter sp.]|nr:hypothetical protein [Geopsychrobacter sp.]
MKRTNKPQQSVFAEAWQNMSVDINKILPQKLRGRKDKWKFGLVLALFELLVLGVVGRFVYHWFKG